MCDCKSEVHPGINCSSEFCFCHPKGVHILTLLKKTRRSSMKVSGLVPAMDGSDRLIPVELEITDPEMIAKIEAGMIKDFSFELKPALPKPDDGGLGEADRNARAYGFEIGRGESLKHVINAVSQDNPFMNPNWRDNIQENEEK